MKKNTIICILVAAVMILSLICVSQKDENAVLKDELTMKKIELMQRQRVRDMIQQWQQEDCK